MKVKVSDANVLELNYMVTLCEFPDPDYNDEDRLVYVTLDVGIGYYSPATDWSQGGPLIEREEIALMPGYQWEAVKNGDDDTYVNHGPTPLIAAMRCYVASKLGEEVEVPDELATD